MGGSNLGFYVAGLLLLVLPITSTIIVVVVVVIVLQGAGGVTWARSAGSGPGLWVASLGGVTWARSGKFPELLLVGVRVYVGVALGLRV